MVPTPLRLLMACLCLALVPLLATAQAPIDISHDVIAHPALPPNAAGQYGQSLLVDRNVHGVLIGGFTFPTHGLPEGSFVVLPPTATQPLAVKLFTAGPHCTWTSAQAINRHPAIVGWCYIRTATLETVEGFYRSESGKVTRLRYPCARFTEAHGVNDQHEVVGWYETWDGAIHGFRWSRNTGQYASFDVTLPGTSATIPVAITNTGVMGATYFTAASTGGAALFRQGHWANLSTPGVQFAQLDDVAEDGRVLGLVTHPSTGHLVSGLWNQGIVTLLTWPSPHVRFMQARALMGQEVVGYVTWDLPVPPEEPHTAAGTITQGFAAKLSALQGDVVGPPPPQMIARRARGASTAVAQMAAVPSVELGSGCPDEAPAPGTQRTGRLSWVGCKRLR